MALSGVRSSWLMLASSRSFSVRSIRASSRAASSSASRARLRRNAETSPPSLGRGSCLASKGSNPPGAPACKPQRRRARPPVARRRRSVAPGSSPRSSSCRRSHQPDSRRVRRGRRPSPLQPSPSIAVTRPSTRWRATKSPASARQRIVALARARGALRGRRTAKAAPRAAASETLEVNFGRRRRRRKAAASSPPRRRGLTAAARARLAPVQGFHFRHEHTGNRTLRRARFRLARNHRASILSSA